MTDACKIIQIICSWLLDIARCFVAVLGYSSVVMQISFSSPQLAAGVLFTHSVVSIILLSTQCDISCNLQQKETSIQGSLSE